MQIQWMEWGKEAFDKAKKESKPILLDIFGSWCHWCHQMEKNTYSDTDVIRKINEKFIPVRVDTDKRPDINERYNQGGWPSTVVLTADGRVVTGVTYLGPREMMVLLHEAAEYHDINEGVVGGDRTKVESPAERKHFGITDKISDEILEELITNLDIDYGGFGFEPKFPLPDTIEFLLVKYRRGRDAKLLKMVEMTLDGIIGAGRTGAVTGIFDNQEGGFFRYSVARDWSIPHYEKMLETNAGLLANCLDAFQLTKNPSYRIAAEKTIEYIRNYLAHTEGGFCSSQDADGEDEYYGRGVEDRRKLDTPTIDRTIYVNLNAMMSSAFIKAATVLGAEYCRAFALKTIDFLMKNCYEKGRGMSHYYGSDGKGHLQGLLADNVYMIKALLDAYELTGERTYLDNASNLADFIAKMQDKEGGFFDRVHGDDDIGYLKMQHKPIVENAVAAEALLRLGIFLANGEYKKAAERTLEFFVNDSNRRSVFAARYGAAIEKFLDPIEIVVLGLDHASLLAYPDNRKIVQPLSADSELAKAKGYKEKGVYICRGHACQRFESAEEALEWLGN